jgi:excisionase family DNA binding protein
VQSWQAECVCEGGVPPAKETRHRAMTLPELPELLTSDEVAELLRVSKRTVERLNLPYIKVGRLRRYLRDDVRDYYNLKRA